jgi:hypothetical protein
MLLLLEQDLVISRALVALFSHETIAAGLAFRGGTALYKLHLRPPELHLPGRFRWSVVTEWVGRIASPAVETRVRRRLEELRRRTRPRSAARTSR